MVGHDPRQEALFAAFIEAAERARGRAAR